MPAPGCTINEVGEDEGCWLRVEGRISGHSEADFHHSICDDCLGMQCPDYEDTCEEEVWLEFSREA